MPVFVVALLPAVGWWPVAFPLLPRLRLLTRTGCVASDA